MADLLDMGRINALPQPLRVRRFGDSTWYKLHDIDVETGLYRMLVCGLLQVGQIGDVAEMRAADGEVYEPELFFIDSVVSEETDHGQAT